MKGLLEGYVDEADGATLAGFSRSTFAEFRRQGIGPKYSRFPGNSRKIIYKVKHIEDWIEDNASPHYYKGEKV